MSKGKSAKRALSNDIWSPKGKVVMKQVLGVLVLAAESALFAAYPAHAQSVDSLAANKALVRAFYAQVINGADTSAADNFLSPDFQYNEGVLAGRDAFKQFLATVRVAIPDYTITIQDMIAEGEWVAVRGVVTGTQKGKLN